MILLRRVDVALTKIERGFTWFALQLRALLAVWADS